MREFNRIFLVGLTRTGTNSLTEALNTLGISIRHYPDSEETFEKISNGFFRIKELETHRGISDVMAAAFYPDFDKEYPGSLFILTLRSSIDEWVESCRQKLKGYSQEERSIQTQIGKSRELPNFLRVATYGTAVWDERRFRYIYERHRWDVQRYFWNRPNDLLTMSVTDGWRFLCQFLEVPEPDVPFPNMKNSGRKQKQESRAAK